jgi:hypothetical protein
MADARPTSFFVVDELFATGSPAFLPTLRAVADPAALAPFAERWLRDPRPWAREQLLAYLDMPLDAVGHNPLFKRLFKGAEARGDDELVGACAVAFDRLVRRVRRKRTRWDAVLRRSVPETHLVTPRDTLAARTVTRHEWNPQTRRYAQRPAVVVAGRLLFSYHTRYYLRRRAWRYFRRKGHQQPTAYAAAVAAFLARYRDADLAAGEHLLDSWSLLHACFGEHEAISFKAHRAVLAAAGAAGGAAAGLAPAPCFPDLWQAQSAAGPLLTLAVGGQARLVRVWAVEVFRRWHVAQPWARGLSLDDVSPLLLHADEAAQLLGVELLASAAGLDRVPLNRWLRLLRAGSLTVLEAVAAAVRQHVDPASVTLFDAVMIANAEPAPVARLGLHFLRRLTIATPQQRQALSNVADLKSPAAAAEIVAWALGVLGAPGAYDVDQVVRFFDSLVDEVRRAAWAWLTATASADGAPSADRMSSADETPPASPGWDDPVLWTRLLETPHEDLRLSLVDALERRAVPNARTSHAHRPDSRTSDSRTSPPGEPGGSGAGSDQEGSARPESGVRPNIEDPRRSPSAPEGRSTAPSVAASPRGLARLGPAALAPLWAAVLLGIHRGGRRKLAALRQVSDAVRSDPASADVLMPVLAAAIRSVRAPEARAGLAAIVSAVGERPELEAIVARALPELQLMPGRS